MATYIQGVTDYIPEYQPFQPDLNFYGNLMQAKQSMYDQNYKSLNNVYNQLYSAELTNKGNVKNRDELLKQLDFNLNRIAGLDLSLEQNVEQAQQVFKPFYENKSLMRDMAYTKNWNNTFSSAQALRTSQDAKQRSQYWDEGIRKMQYEREDFANASTEDILSMADSEYTPLVNPLEVYQKMAEDSKLSVDITQTNGRYFVRQKNGPLLQAPLTELFASKLNSDPSIQSFYKAKVYVDRRDYARANESKFGSIEAAEKDYLTTHYALLKEQSQLQNQQTQKLKTNIETKIDNVTADVKKGEINENTEEYVQSLEEALGIVTVNAEATQNLANELSDKPTSTGTVKSTGIVGLDLSNMALARMQVDMGMANGLANNDINRAAGIFSKRDMIQDMSADPYGVEGDRQANRMQLQAANAASRQNDILLRNQLQKQLIEHKDAIDSKRLIFDSQKGEYVENPAMYQTITKEGTISAGALFGDDKGLLGINEEMDKTFVKEYGEGMVSSMLSYINGVQTAEGLSDEETAKRFLGKTAGQSELEKKISGLPGGNAATNFLTSLLTGKTKDEVEANGGFFGSLVDIAKEEGLSLKDMTDFLPKHNYKKSPAKYVLPYASVLGNSVDPNMSLEQIKKMPEYNTAERKITKTLIKYDEKLRSSKPIFNYSTVADFNADFTKNPGKFLTNRGGEFLNGMANVTTGYAEQNKGASFHAAFLQNTGEERARFNEFTTYIDGKKEIYEGNMKVLNDALESSPLLNETGLAKNKKEIVDIALTGSGGIISQDDFVKLMQERFGDKETTTKDLTANIRNPNLYYNQGVGQNPKDEKTDNAGYAAMYQELKQIYKNTVSNGKELRSYMPLLTEKAQSVVANKENGHSVFLGAAGTPGFNGFMKFMQNDFANINWGDDQNNKISFFGQTKTGLKDMEDLGLDNTKVRGIATSILSGLWSKVGDSKAPIFDVTSKQYALEDGKKGAMIIYPTAEILKPYLNEKVIDQKTYDAMLLNGISFMSDRTNFTNPIFKSNQYSPMQSMVNSLKPGQKFTYKHPSGKGGYNISKDPYGTSEYQLEWYLNDINMPDGTKENFRYPIPPASIGNNIAPTLFNISNKLDESSRIDMENWRRFHKQGNQPKK
tara:strand:+ start:7490 stop:10861 length:3372 start_codon:yes stop_codon:yes gene_type:complete